MFKSLFRKKVIVIMGLIVVGLIGLLIFMPAGTEPIVDETGQKVEGSIAVMEKIELGGVDQWIVMRGKIVDNPILLLLSGGPGASEMGRFLEFNKNLEDDFVMVNWEQRGCGKSFPAIKDKDSLTVEQYVSDINELTNYLKERFNKEKIYLLGHSWGTIIGTKAVQKYPEQFHAYIGAAQMVDVQATDKYMYNYVLEAAQRQGDDKLVKKLRDTGEPPYYGDGMLNKYRPFLSNYADYYKAENPFYEKNTEWYNISSMIMFDEYTFLDKIRYFRGLLNTFPIVYPQLQDLNFVEHAPQLEVPVFYMIGRHDYTARLIEDYYNVLSAPSKELYWFENSAHGEIWTEPNKFHNLMVDEVLPKTLQN